MESTSTRKREFSQPVDRRDGFSICEQLVILLRTRNEIKFLCNRVSLSLRACILAELALCGAIRLREGRVIGRDHIIGNPLLAEAMNKIYLAQLPPGELMYRLNGEKRGGAVHMKNVRTKIYKSLEDKSICRIESKNIVINKIIISNYNARIETTNYIKEYLVENRETDYRAEVLVVCLIFCSSIESVLVCMTEREAVNANAHIKRIQEKYLDCRVCNSEAESIIFPVLKALLQS